MVATTTVVAVLKDSWIYGFTESWNYGITDLRNYEITDFAAPRMWNFGSASFCCLVYFLYFLYSLYPKGNQVTQGNQGNPLYFLVTDYCLMFNELSLPSLLSLPSIHSLLSIPSCTFTTHSFYFPHCGAVRCPLSVVRCQ